MSVTNQVRGTWAKKFQRLTAAAERAQENVLVAVYEAREDGLTNADIGYMIGAHPTGVPVKVAKGKTIIEGRKRS